MMRNANGRNNADEERGEKRGVVSCVEVRILFGWISDPRRMDLRLRVSEYE